MRATPKVENDMHLNRRSFLCTSAAAAGGLLVSLYLHLPTAARERNQAPPAKVYPPDAFVNIRPDGKIVIQVNRLEFGQGIQTGLPRVLADEMDADWANVIAELAPAADVYKDPIYGIQLVGGSGSISRSFQQYRELGAKTRAMLVAAAADRWHVAPDQCRTEASVVHGPAGQSATYAELASEAARQSVPTTVRLKNPTEFRLVGKPAKRLDSRPKCDGSLKFGLDLDLPGMKVAVVAHPPVFGGRVKSISDAEARRVEGVLDVFEIPPVKGTGVAIVADKFWPAKQARSLLKVEWDLTGVEAADTAELRTKYRQLGQSPGIVAATQGDPAAIDKIAPSNRLVAEYEFPFLAHTPMEPLNTTVRFDGDRAEVWAGSQFQTGDQAAVAEVLGLKPEQVTFHTEMAGGGFGRRAVGDSHVQREASVIAKRLLGTPLKLIWTREDDVCNPGERPEGNALDRSLLVMVCSPTWRGEYKATNGALKRETLGTLTILPKGLLPAMRSAQTADLLYCAFDEAFVTAVAEELEGRLAPPHDKRGDLRDRAISEILNLLVAEVQSGGASGRLYVDSLVQALTIRFLFLGERGPARSSRATTLPQQHLFRVQEFIESRLESDLTLQELASEAGYSRSHFLRMFHATTGITPHCYVLNRRIERARRLLADPEMSIVQVAYSCGFSSQAHLTLVFRKLCGLTPGEYRRELSR